jgi:TnpA family transposase
MSKINIFLTKQEREEIIKISENISKIEIVKNYTLNEDDIKLINECRLDYNKIGFALQLGILRHKGWTLKSNTYIPKEILVFLGKQLNINPKKYKQYFKRKQTVVNHLDKIKVQYSYKNFESKLENQYIDFLKSKINENESPIFVIKNLIDLLKTNKIFIPRITTLEKISKKASNLFEEEIYKKIHKFITDKQKQQLEQLLEYNSQKGTAIISWLRIYNGKSSSDEFLETVSKIETIKQLNLTLDLSLIPDKKIEFFIRIGKKYNPASLKRFEEKKRYAILAIFLNDLHQLLIDRAIIIHDIKINSIFNKIKNTQERNIKNKKKDINEALNEYISLGELVLNARKNNENIEKIIEEKIQWNNISDSLEKAKKIVKKSKSDTLEMLDNYYSSLRRYTPTLLKSIDFKNSTDSSQGLIDTLDQIKNLNDTNKRILPDDKQLDLNFASKKWKKTISTKTGVEKRHYIELAALTELKNKLRSGDIYVDESKTYRNFEAYLFSKDEWNNIKDKTKLTAELDVQEYFKCRENKLNSLLQRYSTNYEKLEETIIKDDKLHIKKLDKAVPEEAKNLSVELHKLIPKIKLHDLLFEVFHMTDLYSVFTHAANKQTSNNNQNEALVFAIMGIGTNVGLSKISESLNNISYKQLAHVSEWLIYDENLVKADATMTNHQKKEEFSKNWGDGSTSSSDGMRAKTSVESLTSSKNPHFGFDKGITIYRFICDMYCAFYNLITGPNDRDAIHVIDGLLKHKADLNIKEHYTDTAGYTDQVFALMPLMGFNFAPRIRNLSDLKLYTFDRNKYPKLKKLIKGKINKNLIEEMYDDVLRLAHSIYEKKVSSELILRKLGSYSRNNRLSNALKEMGKIEKTIFILDYTLNPELRRKIQIGLNKSEEMNGLARAIFFGRRGQFWENEMQKQLQKSSCLNIILNAIVIWNTKYLKKAWQYYKTQNSDVDQELLKHISPLNWEHINFLGEYSLDANVVFEEDNLRKLNIH